MLYDISPPLTPDLAVWPGERALTREVSTHAAGELCVTSSSWRASVHLGAHVDAPAHVRPAANTIDGCDLARFVGPCEVMHIGVARGETITPAMLPSAPRAPRLLLATGTRPDLCHFNEDYAALDPDLVDALHACGVRLVGLDTPSVDLFAAAQLPVHRRLVERDILALEGLVLADVPPGLYELIALPLRLVGFEASPVRAVLRTPTPAARPPARY